jgi:hypothetical protein
MNHLTADMLDLYLDDRLDPAAHAAAEAHLAGCAGCRADLAALRQVFVALDSLQPEPIPADLTAQVLAQIAPARPPEIAPRVPRERRRPYAALLGAQAALALLLAIWLGPLLAGWATSGLTALPETAQIVPDLLARPGLPVAQIQTAIERSGAIRTPLSLIPPAQLLLLVAAVGVVWLLCNRLLLAGLDRPHDTRQEAI